MLQLTRTKRPNLMALYNQASDLQTRQTVWVGTKVSNLPKFNGTEWEVKQGHQANSHTRGWQDDGLPAAELADLHTSWQGWTGPVTGTIATRRQVASRSLPDALPALCPFVGGGAFSCVRESAVAPYAVVAPRAPVYKNPSLP